jgi:hypothetical protein
MLDLIFSGRNVFILYLVLAGNFLQPLFPCHSTRLFESSMWIRHVLGFLTLIFFVVVTDTEVDDYLPLGSILAVSAVIYVWFLISSKMTANWWIGLVVLLAALYLIDLYEGRMTKDTPDQKERRDLIKTVILGVSMFLTLFGFLIYVGEKKLEYKNDFNYTTLLLGTPVCKNTPNTTPYIDSLKAAFLDKPWLPSRGLRGGGDASQIAAITESLMANDDFRAVSTMI